MTLHSTSEGLTRVDDIDDVTMVDRLRSALVSTHPQVERWSAYYEGRQPLSYLAPELQRELEGRVRAVIVNWPRLVVDSLEERLDVEGFRWGSAPADGRLWEWWQVNGLDEQSQAAHVEALVSGRAYAIVGAGDTAGDPPVITVESASQVVAAHDPRTRRVTAALKLWRDMDVFHATLYRPDRTVWLVGQSSAPSLTDYEMVFGGVDAARAPGVSWTTVDVDEHRLGAVPVVPLVNRARVLDQGGVSELADIVPLSDAACKVATDMMVSAEYHAIPRRWVVGMTEDDMVDAEGRPLSKWDKIAGRVWAASGLPSEVQLGQFPEADLRNFHDTLNSLARMVAAMAGLPPHFLGWSDSNPASADAIRSAETRLVKRAERRQRAFGGSWEQVMRLGMMIADGEMPADAARLETVWRDASTPTVAQRADAVSKLRMSGLISQRQAREDLGYSAEQIRQMETDDEAAAGRLLDGDFAALLAKPAVPADAAEG